jgi:hypothetical protein
MTAITAYSLPASLAAKRCAGRVRGMEKATARQQSDGEYSPSGNRQCRRAAAQNRRALCQSGTQEHAPLWNGPRLRSAFAAQVLGQAMGASLPQNTSAHAAYRGFVANLPRSIDEEF